MKLAVAGVFVAAAAAVLGHSRQEPYPEPPQPVGYAVFVGDPQHYETGPGIEDPGRGWWVPLTSVYGHLLVAELGPEWAAEVERSLLEGRYLDSPQMAALPPRTLGEPQIGLLFHYQEVLDALIAERDGLEQQLAAQTAGAGAGGAAFGAALVALSRRLRRKR